MIASMCRSMVMPSQVMFMAALWYCSVACEMQTHVQCTIAVALQHCGLDKITMPEAQNRKKEGNANLASLN